MKTTLILLFSFISLLGMAQNKNANKSLDQMITKGISDWQVPGLTTVVVKDGQVVFSKAYGVRDINSNTPVDKETLFSMASTTKAIICIAIGMLVDEGLLNWHDKVRTHMPSFKLSDAYITENARVEDLLLHNLGIGGIAAAVPFVDDQPTTEMMIDRYAFAKKSYPLRGGFDYQNMMFVHAGELIKKVTGLHWSTFVEQRVLKPIGMVNTVTTSSEFSKSKNISSSHAKNDAHKNELITTPNIDHAGAAGSLHSCASDMEKYLLFLTNDGIVGQDTLLTKKTFSYLFEPKEALTADQFGYPASGLNKINWRSLALGWFQHDYRGKKLDYHTGSLPGTVAIAALMHEENLGIYVFGNLDHAELRHAIMYKAIDLFAFDDNSRDWNGEVFNLFQNRKKGTEEKRNKFKNERVADTKPTLALETYVGKYDNNLLGTIEITLVEQQLVLTLNNNSPRNLSHWHYDTFKSEKLDYFGIEYPSFLINKNAQVDGLNLFDLTWEKTN